MNYIYVMVCQVSQVHKIRETNFVNLRHVSCEFKISEKFIDISMSKTLREDSNLPSLPRIFSCKTARWGRVTFFLKKNIFIALIT
jgi:hypothetical protein